MSSKSANAKIERDLAWRMAGYYARLESGKGLLAREWDDLGRLERHFCLTEHEKSRIRESSATQRG